MSKGRKIVPRDANVSAIGPFEWRRDVCFPFPLLSSSWLAAFSPVHDRPTLLSLCQLFTLLPTFVSERERERKTPWLCHFTVKMYTFCRSDSYHLLTLSPGIEYQGHFIIIFCLNSQGRAVRSSMVALDIDNLCVQRWRNNAWFDFSETFLHKIMSPKKPSRNSPPPFFHNWICQMNLIKTRNAHMQKCRLLQRDYLQIHTFFLLLKICS